MFLQTLTYQIHMIRCRFLSLPKCEWISYTQIGCSLIVGDFAEYFFSLFCVLSLNVSSKDIHFIEYKCFVVMVRF